MKKEIQPVIVGSGRAALAIERSLGILQSSSWEVGTDRVEFKFLDPIRVKRGEELKKSNAFSLLVIANPHALHSERILEGDQKRFDLIVSEKPACVSLDDIEKLKKVKTPTAICHVYRQSWGMQSLKRMIDDGDFGEIISLEGRYWQSSAAQSALSRGPNYAMASQWKNNSALSGPHDALIDITTHWADAALFLAQSPVVKTGLHLSYVNSEAPHRDTHVHLNLAFENNIHALASVSKAVHGMGNYFEMNVIGSKKSATWNFQQPDQLIVGEGASLTTVVRKDSSYGSGQAAFHALGWIEGYVEILKQSLLHSLGLHHRPYPTLHENLKMLEILLTALH